MYIVYILFSETTQKHYTGFTSNIEQRMLSHNFLGKDWTSKYRPWNIIFTKDFEDKKEAMAYEKWLKVAQAEDL